MLFNDINCERSRALVTDDFALVELCYLRDN